MEEEFNLGEYSTEEELNLSEYSTEEKSNLDEYLAAREAKKQRKKRLLWLLLLLLAVLALLVAGGALLSHFLPHDNTPDGYRSEVESVVENTLPENPVDFEKLRAEQNDDIVAWIYMPNMDNAPFSAIDYPILQSSAEEAEDFYLTHGLDKNYLFDGCVYMQKVNAAAFSDPNTILYGHNLYNKSMFSGLRQFRDADYFNSHDTFYIYLPGHILTYRIYSAFVYDDRHIYYSFDFNTTEGYSAFLAETLSPKNMVRQVREGVSVTTDDRIVTLSTCTNNANERYLVEGVLVDDQPTQ